MASALKWENSRLDFAVTSLWLISSASKSKELNGDKLNHLGGFLQDEMVLPFVSIVLDICVKHKCCCVAVKYRLSRPRREA